MRKNVLASSVALLAIVCCQALLAAPIRLRSGEFEPPNKARVSAQPTSSSSRPLYYIVQFQGPVREDWKRAIESLGAKLADYIPDYAFIVKLTPQQAKQAKGLDCVRWLGRLAPVHRAEGSLRKANAARVDVIIRLFAGEPSAAVEKLIKDAGGQFDIESKPTGTYIKASVPSAVVNGITASEEVSWVEEWTQPRLTNNVAQQITGVADTRQRSSLFGDGQLIAFADTGLDTGNQDTLSADFHGRVQKVYALRRPNEWTDIPGHGTHVIGIAAGSGALSGSNPGTHNYAGSFAGVAPEAHIILQSIGDNTGYVYPPLNLADLFEAPYDDGARIHSNSWGSPSMGGNYTVYSRQVDDFAWNHKDFVMVFPAGNDARDGDANGIVDLGSIYAPGTAKNCITVGATESMRDGIGKTGTYGGYWITDFPAYPLYSDHMSEVSSAGKGMVAWSGRGPCIDGRIKPDICAPGTNIISDRSHATGAQDSSWGVYDANYQFNGGTSMSTPMVAGAAALVREYYIKSKSISPSSALVKATLLNGATDIYPGQYGNIVQKDVPSLRPNNAEGWGRLNLPGAVDPVAPKVTGFVDDGTGVITNEVRSYQYTVLSSATPLAVTLVWTDPPASLMASAQLVNDLNLTVTAPGGVQHFGNGGLAADTTNNVESVDLGSPSPGVYTITVTGYNVAEGPQPFALVVSGALPGGYVTGTVETASGNPISAATITASDGSTTKTTTTSANGSYTLHLEAATYTVTPSKTGWTFGPANRQVVVADAGVTADFTGSAPAGRITGTVSKITGGSRNYFLESLHPYDDNSNINYTITGNSGATRIRVHFAEIDVEPDYDYLYVGAPGQAPVSAYSGSYEDLWSDWVDGNTVQICLQSDEMFIAPNTFYGFVIDGYETTPTSSTGKAGVTLTAQPGGATTVTQPDGTYAFEGLEPVAYTIVPDLQHWAFKPDSRPAEAAVGGTTGGVDFEAYPPGSITGRVTTGPANEHANSVGSPHPYPDNSTLSYSVTGPTGTSRIRVHFSRIHTESGFDWVFVRDAGGNVVAKFTGGDLSGVGDLTDVWSPWVTGNSLEIVLQSDQGIDNTYYGFQVDKYAAVTGEHGTPGVSVQIQPGGPSAVTDAGGYYTLQNVDEGLRDIVPSRDYFSFMPAALRVNVVSDVQTTGADFLGIVSAMPSVKYIKGLPDGSEVALSSAVVSAGADQMGGFFYIEDTSRISGIKAVYDQTIRERDLVTLVGTIQTPPNAVERYINVLSLSRTPTAGVVPKPFGITGGALGGARLNPFTPGVARGFGAYNVGLLVRMGGTVRNAGADYFYLDDGSGPKVAPGAVGPKVLCGTVSPPLDGSLIFVTGVSSCENDGTRVLRVRKESDILTLYSP